MLEDRDGASAAEPQRHQDHRVRRNPEHAQKEQLHHPGDHQRVEHLPRKEEDRVSEVIFYERSSSCLILEKQAHFLEQLMFYQH